MAAASKQNRFQWNQGNKTENRIHCLSNFKTHIECENIDFNTDKVKQYEAVRKAMNSASLKISSHSLTILCKYVFVAERYAAKDRFPFSSIIL